MTRTEVSGAYRIVNRERLDEKAAAHDPRQVFYRVMLTAATYEEYLAKVGSLNVEVPTFQTGPIDGRMEILYARRSGWIEDGVR